MEVLYLILFAYVTYMLIVTIGITYGYHRYFSHKEFEANNWQEVISFWALIFIKGCIFIWLFAHSLSGHAVLFYVLCFVNNYT